MGANEQCLFFVFFNCRNKRSVRENGYRCFRVIFIKHFIFTLLLYFALLLSLFIIMKILSPIKVWDFRRKTANCKTVQHGSKAEFVFHKQKTKDSWQCHDSLYILVSKALARCIVKIMLSVPNKNQAKSKLIFVLYRPLYSSWKFVVLFFQSLVYHCHTNLQYPCDWTPILAHELLDSSYLYCSFRIHVTRTEELCEKKKKNTRYSDRTRRIAQWIREILA